MRMFVALTPPPSVVEALDEFLEPRREHEALRWTDPEMFHLTLAFCADVPERSLDALGDRLAEVAARHTPFALRLGGGGAFPDPDRAKLLYAAVHGSDAAHLTLGSLAQASRTAATTSGIEVAGGPFRPHVTVARTTRPFSATRWIRVLDAFTGPEWRVEQLDLVRSHVGEGRARRPRYETMESFRLAEGE